MPDKPTDRENIPDFPDDEEIRRQLEELGFSDDEDVANELRIDHSQEKQGEEPRPPNGMPLEHPDLDEIDERMRNLSQRVSNAGSTRMPAPPDWNYERASSGKKTDSDPNNYRGLGIGISAAYMLVGSMAIGFGIGWLIDRGTGGNTWTALLGVGGCIVGIVGVIWMINRGDRE